MQTAHERVTREDLLMFINACFACSGQREFYSDGHDQSVSIEFLHQYVLGNYRALYARTLACGVNDFNQALIIANLLATGKLVHAAERATENALITLALRRLPAHRAMHLVAKLAERKINNRRTRAIVQAFLAQPAHRELRAVKYRRTFWRAAAHSHIKLHGELGSFFTRGWRERKFQTPMFETFRQAHYSEKALYELPFTVAEGVAHKHGVSRETFLARIEPRLTAGERLRLQNASTSELGHAYAIDPAKLSPMKLASYILAQLDRAARKDTFHVALALSSRRAAQRGHIQLGKVACVLDRSYSASGSSEKRRRPLAMALAASYFLAASAVHYTAFWSTPLLPGESEITLDARGATDLATPILDALATAPDLLIIVSDGFDNDPPGVAGQVLSLACAKLNVPLIVHLNPVFDSERYGPKTLCAAVPTMGIRDVENIPTLLMFARFAHAAASLTELLEHLNVRVKLFLDESHEVVS